MSTLDGSKSAELKALARALGAYAAVIGVCACVALFFGKNPFVTTPWIAGEAGEMSHMASATLSLGLGALLAAFTIAVTRVMMRRAAWAKALHADLRPVVRRADDATLFVVALASGVGEEILFRGLLVPAIGVVLPAIIFGAVHQVRGRARWGWMLWAGAMGLALGVIFELSGSLLGPIVAHVAINAVNLRVLRDVEPSPAPARRRLGGLLGRA